MFHPRKLILGFAAAATALVASAGALAQLDNPNVVPNPYKTVPGVWAELPDGREWGANSAVYAALDGKNIWAAERCGGNAGTCMERPDVDPIMLISPEGKILKSFGAGMITWPHGMHVDQEGNVWLTDARGENGKGHQVHKFSPDGELLMSLGKAGVAGTGNDEFDGPSDVLVAPNGDIFVADGHGSGGNNRIVKFDKDGKFIKTWGGTGAENGELRDPHALAMDSQGRLFVGDRGNSRIQIFDQDGEHIDTWTQFGRPSGLYIDKNDVLYSADSESNTGAQRNPGWYRGIRIGSAKDGFVTAFIPDPNSGAARGTSVAEGVTADAAGNVYGAEVAQRMLRKYVPTN
ncbi:MAG: peptidyl-alpha-hydroxyglycine alpha-amidating lyase family protein [Cellvibrionaceae bacterium]